MKLCDYIFHRLRDLGVNDVFCLPGESVQDLYRALLGSKVKSILLAHEPSVGYAADAYARLNGLGAVLVSYGVGSLNLVNAVGQAYAESSPMIVLSGGPGVAERKKYSLLHHKVRNFETKQRVFEEITAMSVIIDSVHDAVLKLEKAFQTALRYKKPVYIEIPRDICNAEIAPQPFTDHDFDLFVDQDTLNEALNEVVDLLNAAKRPVILGGVEVARIKHQALLTTFVEQSGLPIACDLLGKSLIPDGHPQALGTFFGSLSNPQAEKHLQEADLILSLGVILSDVALGMFSFPLDRTKMIEARIESLKVRHHTYPDITLEQLLKGLVDHPRLQKRKTVAVSQETPFLNQKPALQELTSMQSVQLILNQFLNAPQRNAYRVVSDVGDCLFLGLELHLNSVSSFLSPAYYLSMGFGVPGGIGAQIADPSKRSIILVGDGAFQMTGLEVLSAARLGLNPIVILLNNGTYSTLSNVELDPIANSYDIGRYDYYKMAPIFGGVGYSVQTNEQLIQALEASNSSSVFSIIQIDLDPKDISQVMKQFGRMMGEANLAASTGTTH